MLVIDNGDAIRGDSSVASGIDFIINGYVGTIATQLADGQLPDAEADLYSSGVDATVVLSIVLVNIDTSTRTCNLYLKPSGGTSRRVIPKDCSLAAGYSLHTDGVTVNVLDIGGQIMSSYGAHGSSHENGGSDEITISGLSGLAVDDQHVLDAEVQAIKLDDFTAPDDNTDLDSSAAKHGLMPKADKIKIDTVVTNADVTGDNAPQAHDASHQNGGGDEITVSGLSGLLADDQHVLDAEVLSAVKGDASLPVVTITFIIDGGGAEIATGLHGDLEIPFACTINRATMLADQSGSIVVDIWKQAYADYPPEDGESITSASPLTISGAVKSQDSTLSGWTTEIVAGDTLRFNVDSVTDIERVTTSLKATKT